MKIQEVFTDTVVLGYAVPLAIIDLGFIYLNDNNVWNITVNWKNNSCVNKTITAGQLLELFETHADCYPNQKDHFEEQRQHMIEQISKLDASEVIAF